MTPPQAAVPLDSDPFAASVLFLFLQHAPCLAEAFKLAFGVVKQSMACKFPGIGIFPSYLPVFYVGRAQPCTYLSRC